MSQPRIFEIPVFTGKCLLKTRSYRLLFGYFVENWSKIVMISTKVRIEGTNKCSSNCGKFELRGFGCIPQFLTRFYFRGFKLRKHQTKCISSSLISLGFNFHTLDRKMGTEKCNLIKRDSDKARRFK